MDVNMNTAATFKGVPLPNRGLNSRLDMLEKRARRRQIEAQKAWIDLVRAQLSEDEPWARVLACAVMAGVKPEALRKQFDVPPSTFSRWIAGQHSPTQSLRVRLGGEILRLAGDSREKVPALEDAPGR